MIYGTNIIQIVSNKYIISFIYQTLISYPFVLLFAFEKNIEKYIIRKQKVNLMGEYSITKVIDGVFISDAAVPLVSEL
jgi:hypothetical protein